MNLTRAAIGKPRITGAIIVVLVLGGISAFVTMPRAEDPGFTVRFAVVLTYFPGAGPERVEQLVTDKLETAIQEMPEIDFFQSESKTGASVITVKVLSSYKDMRPIWDDLRRKVDDAARDLPAGTVGPFVRDDLGEVFGTILTITGEGYSYAELKSVADEVRDELLRIKDVAKVNTYGEREERIFVEYQNARLAEIGLSPYQLQTILQSRNIVTPGGAINTEDERIVLEPSGSFERIEDLESTVIDTPLSGQLVFLRDVARVHRGYVDPPASVVHSSGRPALALAVSLREGGNILALGDQVVDLVSRLEATYPYGIEFDVIHFQPEAVRDKINGFIGNVLQAIAIIVAVTLVTLGARTGLIVSTVIPTTMVISLLLMSLLGLGLNQMSLAGLIISVGMLIDNGIVVSEAITVALASGEDRLHAIVASVHEHQIPLFTSSLTTAAAFLPIYLAEAEAGEYTGSIFVVVLVTLLCSWILSLTLIPLLCYHFLPSRSQVGEGADSAYHRVYVELLGLTLSRRRATLAAVGVAFILSIGLFRFVPNIFFPPSERAIIGGEVRLPSGSPVEKTESTVTELEAFIRDSLAVNDDRRRGVTNWAAFIGEDGAPKYRLNYMEELASPEYAFFLINLTSRGLRPEVINRLQSYVFRTFPDATSRFAPPQLGPPVTSPVEIRLSGRNTDVLFEILDGVRARLEGIRGTRNIDDDWGQRTKKLTVAVDQARARRAGVSSLDVAISLQTALTGFETTVFREEDEEIPVVLRSAEGVKYDVANVAGLPVFAQATGRSVPLGQVADVGLEWQPSVIGRRNRFRTITISSDVTEDVTAFDVNAEVVPWLESESQNWGTGYFYEIGGDAETAAESQAAIGTKVPIMALVIVFLLLAQFNSFRRAFIVLVTIPLGFMGVVIGLLVARSTFGFMTLLGVVALTGIVINNAIILLDRVRIEIEENGLPPAQALVEAGRRRLRPILLTTATTVLGLLPLWWGGGPMWAPMAVAIIFGLVVGAPLTLLVIPVLYAVLFRVPAPVLEARTVVLGQIRLGEAAGRGSTG